MKAVANVIDGRKQYRNSDHDRGQSRRMASTVVRAGVVSTVVKAVADVIDGGSNVRMVMRLVGMPERGWNGSQQRPKPNKQRREVGGWDEGLTGGAGVVLMAVKAVADVVDDRKEYGIGHDGLEHQC